MNIKWRFTLRSLRRLFLRGYAHLRKSNQKDAGSYITQVLILLLPSFCGSEQTEKIGHSVSNVYHILSFCLKMEAQPQSKKKRSLMIRKRIFYYNDHNYCVIITADSVFN